MPIFPIKAYTKFQFFPPQLYYFMTPWFIYLQGLVTCHDGILMPRLFLQVHIYLCGPHFPP